MLTVGKWHAAAYLREARALFSFKASEMYLTPCAPMLLLNRLRARTERTSQGVLTVGNAVQQHTSAPTMLNCS